MFNILIIEDDYELRKLFSSVLMRKGFNTFEAENGNDALEVLEKEYIDLCLCDAMMPEMDGYEFTKTIRRTGLSVPVLMITVKGNYEDKETGFNCGVDDYMVKPIDVNEMVLRVNALLRRAKIISEKKIVIGNTILYYDQLMIKNKEEEYYLPQKEFYLLYKLLSYPNHIFTKYQLMDEIWGMETESSTHTLEVHIAKLRERFKDDSDFSIVTVRGLGYKGVINNEKA